MNHMKHIICGSVLLTIGFTAGAETIIDGTTDLNGYSLAVTNNQPLGNTYYFSPDLYMTGFSFVYFGAGAGTANKNLGVELNFYEANGPLTFGTYGNPTPGTLLYSSGWYFNSDGTELPNGNNTIAYTTSDFGSFANEVLPASPNGFVFTITFTNLGSSVIDLPLADNQSTISATDYGSYWIYNSGTSSWNLMTNSASIPVNFVTTVQGVPEPSMMAMGILGGALLAAAGIMRRRN